jgi:hypothetical protein
MRKRSIVLSLVAGPAIAVLTSSCGQNVPGSNLTVQCTETLTGADVTNWGVAGHGHCTLTGRLQDSGRTTDYRTQTEDAIFIRRVITSAKGTIIFLVKIPTVGPGGESWTITSGTGAYAKLHGHGYQVVDNYTGTPATFELKGAVFQSAASAG